TFLLVTHDQDEALSLSQYVALMNRGTIEQVADPATLYRRPATLFAARFVGAGTFLPATVIDQSGADAAVAIEGMRFMAEDAGVAAGKPATVMLRPEDIDVVGPGQGRCDGAVQTCAFFGAFYEATVAASLGLFRVRSPWPLPQGENVGLNWSNRAGIAYPDEGG
ncbi:MAG TPA: TOBE domain-containing protein, partial [Thermomicrobiales bacterium]|nr:TOBE domain-containing protein [Thermomicrobiales bacterium]